MSFSLVAAWPVRAWGEIGAVYSPTTSTTKKQIAMSKTGEIVNYVSQISIIFEHAICQVVSTLHGLPSLVKIYPSRELDSVSMAVVREHFGRFGVLFLPSDMKIERLRLSFLRMSVAL
jgi:hypothetical protein